MYSVTGQTEDQQVSHQHCPPCVLIFEIGQPIINTLSPNNYVMKHNGAILYQLYLHVGYNRILRKKLVTVQDVLNIAMRFCTSTLLFRQSNALNKSESILQNLCSYSRPS